MRAGGCRRYDGTLPHPPCGGRVCCAYPPGRARQDLAPSGGRRALSPAACASGDRPARGATGTPLGAGRGAGWRGGIWSWSEVIRGKRYQGKRAAFTRRAGASGFGIGRLAESPIACAFAPTIGPRGVQPAPRWVRAGARGGGGSRCGEGGVGLTLRGQVSPLAWVSTILRGVPQDRAVWRGRGSARAGGQTARRSASARSVLSQLKPPSASGGRPKWP
jgi:hypothetical protein